MSVLPHLLEILVTVLGNVPTNQWTLPRSWTGMYLIINEENSPKSGDSWNKKETSIESIFQVIITQNHNNISRRSGKITLSSTNLLVWLTVLRKLYKIKFHTIQYNRGSPKVRRKRKQVTATFREFGCHMLSFVFMCSTLIHD